MTRESLYKANSLSCFLAKIRRWGSSIMTKKLLWWNEVCKNKYYKTYDLGGFKRALRGGFL